MKDVNAERKKQMLARARAGHNDKVVRYVAGPLFEKLDAAGEQAGVWLEAVEYDFAVLSSRPSGLLRNFDAKDFADLRKSMFG